MFKGLGNPITSRGVVAELLAASDFRVVITGASGWLGMATLEMLCGIYGAAVEGRILCFGSQAKRLALRSGVEFFQRPLSDMVDIPEAPTLLLHYAFLTREKVGQVPLNDYVAANRSVSDFVLSQTRRIGVRGALVVSSGAVYGRDRLLASDLVANPYGFLKLEEERRFSQWAERSGAVLVVPRLFNLSGPYINKHAAYALASLILDSLNGRPIVIRAAHRVVRSYTGVADLLSICLGLFLQETGAIHEFDTAGDQEVEVGELAARIALVLGVKAEILRPPISEECPDRYVGDKTAYRNYAGRLGVKFDILDRQILDTAGFLADF